MVVKLKKGDKVVVFVGKDKGKQGEILVVFLKENKVVVDGVNIVICYICQLQNSQGGCVVKVMLIDLLNLLLMDVNGKVICVGFCEEDGKKVCFVKIMGDVI